MNVGSLEATLRIKTNIELPCEAFSGKLAANPGALKSYIVQKNYVPS